MLNAIQLVCEAYKRKILFYPNTWEPGYQGGMHLDNFFTTIDGFEPYALKSQTTIPLLYRAFRARPGVSSYALLQQVFEPQNQTAMDCAGALDLAYWLTFQYILILAVDHDEAKAEKRFNELFNQIKGDKNSLLRTFAVRTNIFNLPVSPLRYFAECDFINVKTLQENPDRYKGLHMDIAGHKNYLKNHSGFFGQAWNVVFNGLVDGQLTFWVPHDQQDANSQALMTYDEILQKLADSFNKAPLPSISKKDGDIDEASATIDDMGGLHCFSEFDYEKLSSILEIDPLEITAELRQIYHNTDPNKTRRPTPTTVSNNELCRLLNLFTLARKEDPKQFLKKQNYSSNRYNLFISFVDSEEFQETRNKRNNNPTPQDLFDLSAQYTKKHLPS